MNAILKEEPPRSLSSDGPGSRRRSTASCSTASRRVRTSASSRRATSRSSSMRSRARRCRPPRRTSRRRARGRRRAASSAARVGRRAGAGVLAARKTAPKAARPANVRSASSRSAGNGPWGPASRRTVDGHLRRRLGRKAGRAVLGEHRTASESRALGLPNADILSVSSSGELAILIKKGELSTTGGGTLARVPLGGGAPREVAEDVI